MRYVMFSWVDPADATGWRPRQRTHTESPNGAGVHPWMPASHAARIATSSAASPSSRRGRRPVAVSLSEQPLRRAVPLP
jgi:hypothetical protein